QRANDGLKLVEGAVEGIEGAVERRFRRLHVAFVRTISGQADLGHQLARMVAGHRCSFAPRRSKNSACHGGREAASACRSRISSPRLGAPSRTARRMARPSSSVLMTASGAKARTSGRNGLNTA